MAVELVADSADMSELGERLFYRADPELIPKKQVAEETEKARIELEKDIENYARDIGEKILGRAC